MNWLAKINLGVVVQRIGAFKSSLFLFILITLCLFIGYRVGNYYHHVQTRNLEQQQIRLDELFQQQAYYIARADSLEVELAVEQLANQAAQAMLKKEAEHYVKIKKQLAFYEKIMAPEKQAGSLSVDDIKVSATNTPNLYRFQVTLVQQKLKRRYTKGFIDLHFIGSLDEKPMRIKLAEVSAIVKKDLSFSFQYFQIISGEFTLPEEFKVEELALTVNISKSREQKKVQFEQLLPWQLD
jgi:hypothetical protein